jgi:Bacterial Ig domain
MRLTSTLLTSAMTALVAALSLAAGTASATSPPTLSAGPGCSVQCISKAAVTATATAAKVELATTVPANLKVTVGKQPTGGNGGFVANQAKTVNVPATSPLKTAFFLHLEPDTTYAISVRATDLQGRSSVRSGTFKTLPIKTTGHSGSNSLDTGVGCSKQCITKALVSQRQPDATSARVEIKTSTTAHIQIDVSRDKPEQTSVGLVQWDVVSRQWTGADTKSWTPLVTGLDYGTKYYVVVRARDAQGRVSMRQGSFRTVSATATITFDRIKVLNDGDKVGKGELFFNLWVNGDYAWGTGLRKLSSGDLTNVNPVGSSRPGLPYTISADGDAKLSVEMLGEECDELSKKNCVLEAQQDGPAYATFPQWASASGRFDVSDLLEPGALPGWYGTGVAPPAGHDGYFTFGTTDHYVKFLVLATIDLHVDWP